MTDPSLRIIFAGTPDFAASHLEDLINRGFNVIAVYTQPDRPVGRGKHIHPTPVKEIALAHSVPVFQPEKLGSTEAEQLRSLTPDVMVVVAYGLILSLEILQIPRFGCINVHASLLPRWRGAAPIERAILAGDSVTGVSIMQMESGLDTGDVLLQLDTPVSTDDNAASVTTRLLELGNQGLASVLGDLSGYQIKAQPQDDALACYAKKLNKDEALIHWQSTAIEIQHQVQAFFPRSPAYCFFKGERLRILQALAIEADHKASPGTVMAKGENSLVIACGENALEIHQIQLPGKKAVSIRDAFNGHPDLFNTGDVLAGEKPL